MLREHLPDLKVRVVNVVDLMRLQPDTEHPHGLPDREFDALFTADRPVIFAYHGYPWLIHRLTYRRANHDNIHVRGYKEEGTTTTPFDMVMLNDMDRFHLVMDVIDRVPGLGDAGRGGAPADGRRAACATAPTRARSATTCPRCATGCWPRLSMRVLVVNAGSSSLKLRLLDAGRRGRLDERDLERRLRTSSRTPLAEACASADAVGHRVVHGGPSHTSAACASTTRSLARPARAHRPRAAAPAARPWPRSRRSAARCPALPAVACFDTAFHATLPAAARDLRAARRAGASASGCAATASTGSRTRTRRGAPRSSWTARRRDRHLPPRRRARRSRAVRDGRSVDTTMGFTPLEGLVMATRSGSVDPGLVAVAARARARLDAGEIDDALEHESGLLGLAGTARHARGARRAPTAATTPPGWRSTSTCTACAPAIAAMAASLGGLDALVFTGGVGEHAPRGARRGGRRARASSATQPSS